MKVFLLPICSAFLIFGNIGSKRLFFKDLASRAPYSSSHIYRALDHVVYKDSILYSKDSDILLIGTNSTIAKLDIHSMRSLQELKVSKESYPSPCFRDKYASEYPCHLFGYWSKIIPSATDLDKYQLFICHNNGLATYYDVKTFDTLPTDRSNCPALSVISFLSIDMQMYVGSLERGASKIIRFSPEYPSVHPTTKKKTLSTYIDSSWIQQNDYLQFVFVFENGNFIYFLLRETAEEDNSFCHVKSVKSRIVRISKDDNGGSAYKLKDMWVSFLKATILCPDKSQSLKDSVLNYIENAFFDIERQILYATFSSGESAFAATAICLYLITDIDSAFEGPYMNFLEPRNPIHKTETTCQTYQLDCIIHRAARYQLKFAPVLPMMKKNLILHNGEIWTHLQVLTIDRSSRQYDIVFIATSKGEIKKYFRKLTDTTLCYSETLILLSNHNHQPSSVRDMKLINSKTSPQPFLVVTVDNGVYKIGIEHCVLHSLEAICIDPFCFWDRTTGTCTSIFQIPVYKLRQIPELRECTRERKVAHLRMGKWSSWSSCVQNGGTCLCRTRHCNPGACVNADPLVGDYEVEVTNCSNHQQWSSWTPWSECSSKCGIGNSTRERWCFPNGNCPGASKETKLCYIKNQCKAFALIDEWNDWSPCSSKCGEGVITRTKKCLNKFHSNEVENDICSLVEFLPCQGTTCPKITKLSPVATLMRDSKQEFYLASCQGNILHNESEMDVSVKYDFDNSSWQSSMIWSCWSEWTGCNNQCSESPDETLKRSRNRFCKVKDEVLHKELCHGAIKEEDDCNDDLCLKYKPSSSQEGFQLIHVIMVGVASFTASCLTVVAGVCIYFSKRKTMITYTKNTWPVQSLQRKSFIRESYSPTLQSPSHSPLDYGWMPTDGYSSLLHHNRRLNAGLVEMAIPQIETKNF